MSKHTEHESIVQALLELYSRGQFPMADLASGEIWVHDPDPRAIIPLDGGFRVARSLAQRVRSGRFAIRSDTAFEAVMHACATPRPGKVGGEDTWISEELIAMYCALHRAGHAHSVEAWLPRQGAGPVLVGGLYGVHIGGLFAGESMFSRPELGGTDASKVCLVRLVEHLRSRGFRLLDTQFSTPHLARFGAVEVRRSRYRVLVREAIGVAASWNPFDVHSRGVGASPRTSAR